MVTLSAVGSVGYVFEKWSGDVGSSVVSNSTISIKMDVQRTITASFAKSDVCYRVTAMVELGGFGSVELRPSQPAEGYLVNTNVFVHAAPEAGYVFSHWIGDLAGPGTYRTIHVGSDKSITAVFHPTVSVNWSPFDGGSVALEPESSDNAYAAGTEVTITAKAAEGYRFVSWDGDLSGSDKSTIITVDEAKTITARFTEESASRWWLWVILGMTGLFGVLVIFRLARARLNRGTVDEPHQPGA